MKHCLAHGTLGTRGGDFIKRQASPHTPSLVETKEVRPAGFCVSCKPIRQSNPPRILAFRTPFVYFVLVYVSYTINWANNSSGGQSAECWLRGEGGGSFAGHFVWELWRRAQPWGRLYLGYCSVLSRLHPTKGPYSLLCQSPSLCNRSN